MNQQQQQPGTYTGQDSSVAQYSGQGSRPQNQVMSQQPGYQPQMNTVLPIFYLDPCPMTCIFCGAQIITNVRLAPSNTAWICFILLFIFCCCLSWIPCCLNTFKIAEHSCPNCYRVLGKSEDQRRM